MGELVAARKAALKTGQKTLNAKPTMTKEEMMAARKAVSHRKLEEKRMGLKALKADAKAVDFKKEMLAARKAAEKKAMAAEKKAMAEEEAKTHKSLKPKPTKAKAAKVVMPKRAAK